MNKKEFLERYSSLIMYLGGLQYDTFTCNRIETFFSRKAKARYHYFIKDFLNVENYLRNNLFNETTTEDCLRELLIHQFKDECVRSKIYRRF